MTPAKSKGEGPSTVRADSVALAGQFMESSFSQQAVISRRDGLPLQKLLP
jgi:hypothetical protein